MAGIDLNPSLIDLATMLTTRTKLSEQVAHATVDATDLPFDAQRFDFAWPPNKQDLPKGKLVPSKPINLTMSLQR